MTCGTQPVMHCNLRSCSLPVQVVSGFDTVRVMAMLRSHAVIDRQHGSCDWEGFSRLRKKFLPAPGYFYK